MKARPTPLIVLGFAMLGTPALCFAQSTEYTLPSFGEKMLKWSVEAAGYNEYRWEKTRKELLDDVIGSTIRIKGLKVYATEIQANDGKAVYKHEYDPGDLGISVPAGASGFRLTDRYYNVTSFRKVRVELKDTSDRLAMELAGESNIDIVGRIREATVTGDMGWDRGWYGVLSVVIDITTWSKSQ